MTRHTLSKTILAVAITAASASAFAVSGDLNKDVSGPTEVAYSRADFNNVTLSGNAERDTGQDGTGFEGVNIAGDLTNNANVSGQGEFIDGLDLDSSDDADNTPTTVGGNVTNNGNMKLSGIAPVGIITDGAKIGGNLTNNGNISVVGETNNIDADTPRGIELGNTQLGGDLVNAGTLSVDGTGAKGIYAFTSKGTQDLGTIGKDVINKGAIFVSGNDSSGVNLENINFGRDVVNQGIIAASGNGTSGVVINDMNYNAVVNTGTIQASGDDAVGVRLVDAVGPEVKTATNGIVNTGSIMSTGTAISVESIDYDTSVGGSDNANNLYVINQKDGLILGKEKSINGNFQTQLNWTGGTITGDMEGMKLVQVEGSGTFNGKEIEAFLVDVKSGTLYLASTDTSFTGDLNVASGSTLQLLVSDQTNPTNPILNVAGDASFASGSKIGVTANPGDFTGNRAGTTYTLVKAGTLTDDGLTVVSNSALLNIIDFKVNGDSVTAIVAGKSGSSVADDLAKMGASRNASNAIRPFADSVLGQLDANDAVFKAFANADDAELARLAEQLSPNVNGGSTQAALGGQTLVSSALNGRNAEVRGLSSGDVLQETGVWVKTLYSNADQGTRDGVSGFNAYSSGIVVGADGKVNPDLTLGVAYSYINSKVNGQSNETDVDAHALTAYGSWTQGPAFVDASVTVGKNENSSKRDIATTVAKGDYDSDLFGVNVLGGYGFNFDNGFLVEPRAALRYSNLKIDGYTEKGSSAALSVGGQRVEVGEIGGGVRVEKDFNFMNGTLKPTATAMVYHDFIGDKSNTTSTYTLGGTPFVSSGASSARDSFELGLGAEYSIGAVTVGASYSYLKKTDFNADTFTVSGRWDF
ncbi:autotransporter domain-containing protein [Pseudomonas sp. P66]|uniref:Autotransporter domain-containing protein n=1 Tax=Pseudomonas arcuscaelestis TaxID=2710591 RepID=A0ABS2BZP5_9PSED|nr:autotransporter outer membrane beta-barrel domain-containing protein [Pseudomonas arcuscaelestis]MBM5459101.1 autotransporter domain-containing protein [Pseudomonas arcuscaelestis]